MSAQIALQVQWLRWWSNPLIQLHPDYHAQLPFSSDRVDEGAISYFQLLQTRSVLELDDLPDPTLETYPSIALLPLANIEIKSKYLLKMAALTLGNFIIHARPPEWEAKFDIKSPDDIRRVIECYRDIPRCLSRWQFGVAIQINADDSIAIPLTKRIELGLGLILRSYFPSLFKRWRLTVPYPLVRLAEQTEPLETGFWPDIHEWLQTEIESVSQHIRSDYEEPTLGEVEETLFESPNDMGIDVDARYEATHA